MNYAKVAKAVHKILTNKENNGKIRLTIKRSQRSVLSMTEAKRVITDMKDFKEYMALKNVALLAKIADHSFLVSLEDKTLYSVPSDIISSCWGKELVEIYSKDLPTLEEYIKPQDLVTQDFVSYVTGKDITFTHELYKSEEGDRVLAEIAANQLLYAEFHELGETYSTIKETVKPNLRKVGVLPLIKKTLESETTYTLKRTNTPTLANLLQERKTVITSKSYLVTKSGEMVTGTIPINYDGVAYLYQRYTASSTLEEFEFFTKLLPQDNFLVVMKHQDEQGTVSVRGVLIEKKTDSYYSETTKRLLETLFISL